MIKSVLHFTTVHPARDVRIFHKECRTLAAAGYEVSLMAPGGADEVVDGVRFIPLPPAQTNRFRRALLGNVQVLRRLLAARADVYHFHDPELLPLGLALKVLRRRVIYDVHEHVRDDIRSKPYLGASGRRILLAIVGTIEWLVGRSADLVIAATPIIAAQFPANRTVVVHNYPMLEELPDGQFTLAEFSARPLAGCYTGAMSPLRHADEMFAAADQVRSNIDEFRLVTAGAMYKVDDPSDHPGVDYRGIVDRSAVGALLVESRFGVMLLADAPNCADGLPTKFFEYAASGLPVVVSRSTHGIASIVDAVQCGIAVDETSPEDISRAMVQLLESPADAYAMGQRGAAAMKTRYHWGNEATTLLAAYRKLS